jgi:hypothetical protein
MLLGRSNLCLADSLGQTFKLTYVDGDISSTTETGMRKMLLIFSEFDQFCPQLLSYTIVEICSRILLVL